jgi:hypothetical protein
MGYSMGGGATLESGANVEAIANNNIAAGVAIGPTTSEVMVTLEELYGPGSMPYLDVAVPVIPMLYAVMESDDICRPEDIRPNYDASPSEQKVWANLARAGHMELVLATQRWSYATINMFDCHLKNDENACSIMY